MIGLTIYHALSVGTSERIATAVARALAKPLASLLPQAGNRPLQSAKATLLLRGLLRRARLLVQHQALLSVSYLVYALALGSSGVLQVILLFFLARTLPSAEFGVVALLMVLIPLLARICPLGTDIGLAIRIWREPFQERIQGLGAVLSWILAGSMALSAVVFIVSPLLAASAAPSMIVGAILVAGCRSWLDIYQAILRREDRVFRVGVYIVIRALLVLASCAIFVLTLYSNALGYLFGLLVAEGLMVLSTFRDLRNRYGVKLYTRGSTNRLRVFAQIGFPTVPSTAAAMITAGGDRYVIGAFIGPSAAGVYSLGQKLADYVTQMLFVPFSTAFGPYALKASTYGPDRGVALIERTATALAYIGGVILGLFALFVREVFSIFGPEYQAASLVFLVASMATLIQQVSQILAAYFSQTARLKQYMWLVIAAAVFSVVSNIALVPRFGMASAAFVSVVVYQLLLVGIVLTARAADVTLVSLPRLQFPIALYAGFLLCLYAIGSATPSFALEIAAKVLLWGGYLTLCILISADVRDVLRGLSRRIKKVLNA